MAFQVKLYTIGGVYKLRGRTEQRRYIGSRSIHYLNNASQLIEVEYLAATNGYFKLWLEDALVDPVNLENDTCAVNGMNRGAMWSIPSGTLGTIYTLHGHKLRFLKELKTQG